VAKKVAKQVESYTHKDKPCGDRWKPGYFAAYCQARADAIKTGILADAIYGRYLYGDMNDEDDAHAVQAAEWLDRLTLGYWREAVYLWTEGEL